MAAGQKVGTTDSVIRLLQDLKTTGILDGGAAMWVLAAFHDEATGAPVDAGVANM